MQRASRQMLRRDRDANVQRLRMMAEEAANHNNMSKSFAIVKVLAGRTVKKVDALKDEDGTMITDEVGKKLRWQRHHANVFGATIAPSVRDAVKPVGSRLLDARHYSVQRIQKRIDALAYGKACGPDMIMAELIKAGGAT